ncbi:cbb3-type cytochrome c oxidase N-terminal domain-containing protein [Hymenobacter sp. YC55]|uniref:cbb3-type cytochrome c oxidase N-terminal domain-containing protein n=1 Tax=Hymenobacter sp. YC55 TaxID=3034019 RepID=UPI0023F9B841|nr:cbb3-type cytochrome c oxidase N-terminal domain-containing protein [Hymenobacter sp. YC55]MDF7811583.1 cbb3-type cytochrome c oxidase N-terminal domain-containing protein [Hymenobacter sp. YC55]
MIRFRSVLAGTVAVLFPAAVLAQATATAEPASAAFATRQVLFWLLLGTLAVVVLLFLVLLVAVIVQLRPRLRKVYNLPTVRSSWSGKVLGLLVGDPVLVRGEVRDEILDHDYDGIHEFDNDLPPWWKYGFYLTIVFAVGYLSYYHVAQAGKLSQAEYETEMQQAALLVSADADDPNKLTTYQPLTTPADLSSGKALFATNCAPCHGASAEGKVGPNLTDEYWLHGGEVNHVYKTIKFGVQGKGMVAWKGKLSGKQILQVSSYILSLQGTKPANAKEPQGEKETLARPLASR